MWVGIRAVRSFPFLIQDRTPREQRAFPLGKPVTKEFRGVTRVVIAVRNLDDAIERYRKAYGVPRPIKQVDKSFEGYLALLGDLPVVLAQPLNAGSWLTERIERFGEGPCAFVLGAVNPGHFRAASKTRWFGAGISWFDSEKLGWRLGFEAVGSLLAPQPQVVILFVFASKGDLSKHAKENSCKRRGWVYRRPPGQEA